VPSEEHAVLYEVQYLLLWIFMTLEHAADAKFRKTLLNQSAIYIYSAYYSVILYKRVIFSVFITFEAMLCKNYLLGV